MKNRTDKQPTKPEGRLTADLEAMIPDFRMKWRSLAFETRPIRHAEAEDLVCRIYRAQGQTPPERFVWATSPGRALAAAALLEASHPDPWERHIRFTDWGTRNDLGSFLDRQDAERLIELLRDPWVENLTDFLLASAEREMMAFGNRSWDIVRSQLEREAGEYPTEGTLRRALDRPRRSIPTGIANRGYLAACEFVHEAAGHPIKRENRLLARLQQDFGPFFYSNNNVAVLLERATYICLDEAGRVHNDCSPAISYRGSAKLYAWHGVAVAPHVIEQPHLIELREIMSEPNAEIRRVLIERYGWERYIEKTDARVMDSSEAGTLLILPSPERDTQEAPEAIRVLRVQNSTPEQDGTRKNYFIRVPPDILTAKAAVAWSFGMSEKEYAPLLET